MPAGFPSVIPAGPPLSFPPVSPITNVGDKVSGNPGSCFVVRLFVWACMEEAMDSRLKMSGMTEGGLKASGMTEGGLTTWGMTEGLLCLFVMPAGPSLSCPPGPLCHARWSPLSFPPVVSGNPVSCFVVPCFVVLSFVWACMGKAMDSRLKMSGMTEGGIEHGGHDGMSALPLCHARQSSLSCRRGPFVIPAGLSLSCRRAPSVIPAGC